MPCRKRCALDFKTAEEVHDVLINPPQTDKYHSLKCALIKAFGKSQTQWDYELLNLNGLGNRKPTALLRKINVLNDDLQTLKRALFLSNLPADVRTIMSGQEFSDLDKLAEAADRVWEARSASIQHITQTTNKTTPDCVESICNRSHNPRRTGSSTAPSTAPVCFYHTRFGPGARKCQPGCKFASLLSGNNKASG
ncbi:retrovirus-related Pol polyprotein [Elysia marginata]|uniref:Retrovirus-related Pol polyprotein n=1 Tax=Elysia marginata TaxID=1093978 RepID=A0AAV4ECL6_9GAST|nr:retrovirus-related Pol polyprotein [Elysia marginata]